MADEYPSPEASHADLVDPIDMSTQLANQAAAQARALASAASSSTSPHPVHHHQAAPHTSITPTPDPRASVDRYKPTSGPPATTNAEQIKLLRDFYTRNPNPSRRDLEVLAEHTGRPFTKVREYFRQRRNKLRGLGDLERMEEPGRASGWCATSDSAHHI